jgi:hypothetical protein
LESWLLTVKFGVCVNIATDLAKIVQANPEAGGKVGQENYDDTKSYHVELIVTDFDILEHFIMIKCLLPFLSSILSFGVFSLLPLLLRIVNHFIHILLCLFRKEL